MSQAHSENGSTPDILPHLEAYEQMSEQSERFASLKENVEKERQSVKLHIYERVKAEYEEKIQTVERELKKQRERLQEQIRDLLDRRTELKALCRKDSERLEEIDFRTRVGEFTEEECRAERSEIETRTQQQSNELGRLEQLLGRCTRSGLLSEQEASDGSATTPKESTEDPPLEQDPPEQAAPASIKPDETETEPEALECAATEVEADFEIVEEEAPGDDHEAPVVHCPPNVSSPSPQGQGNSKTEASRSGPQTEIREYVTGYLVALEGSRQGERFPMISSNITLGSSLGIDIRLSDSGIANFHARILYKERKHFLENLDAMGRSFVNGVQAADLVELKDGDVIRLGDIKMQVEYASAKQTTSSN
jgi:pSer/pThr/pTyr-binding forkhead associated (FHA) protein